MGEAKAKTLAFLAGQGNPGRGEASTLNTFARSLAGAFGVVGYNVTANDETIEGVRLLLFNVLDPHAGIGARLQVPVGKILVAVNLSALLSQSIETIVATIGAEKHKQRRDAHHWRKFKARVRARGKAKAGPPATVIVAG